MDRFYSKVNAIVHNRNLLKDSIIVEEKAEAYQLKKALRLKENDIRIKAVRAKYVRELRASRAAEEAEVCVAPTDGVLIVEDLPEVPKTDTPKTWNKRPSYWESIADYYVESNKSIDAVLQLYDKEFEGYNSRQAKKSLNRWVQNKKNNIKVDYQRRQPVYGFEVDMQLLSAVKERMKLGLPIDAFILRVLLLALLSVVNKLDLLTINGGKSTGM